MQALSDRVNTCRDRQVRSRVENPTGKATSAGSQPAHPVATSVRSVRRALPVMRLGDHRRLAVAIIAVGLAIAAANRAEDLVAEFRHRRAGAGLVETPARSGLELAELPGVALNAGNAAALLAGLGRLRACGIEIINASAAASETKRPVLMISSQCAKQPEITYTTSAPR